MRRAPRTRMVLVVEDDEQLRHLYRSALIEAGYTVRTVEDGIEALRVLDQHLPNAVILDLDLPRLSGRDVGQELRAQAETRHIPIIVVTDREETAAGFDADCILQKPFSADRLVHVVNICMRKANQAEKTVEGASAI